ncbi:arylalkylamine N-acetyltransferase 1-like [Uranotaenia lowii]|uniref:arylalkylamine N-acetyltransferase 1-like n=1 Tax=Uranotaenia lowii TaxID=190385 RepID=UPI00247A137B|nr:arylalkylamine N-acetyltransferase 1-like [Uranotaenia lowii]
MASSNNIVIRVARPEEVELVRQVLRTIYYPEEAITVSYKYGKDPTPDDEKFSLSFVEPGYTVLAEDTVAKKFVGVSVGGPIYPGDPDLMLKEAATTETRKWSDILKLLAQLERTADVCGKYQLDRAYHVHILAVDSSYRGRGLGKKILDFQINLAKEHGFGAISGDFTSVFSARIAEQLGMESISQLSLADYRDDKGEHLFDPIEVNRLIKTCVKLL